uniref:Uncharacterized protein n=1 Tax=uncultured marine microorganism HF4000_ANIW93N21 TaxID=455527 RepID=B3T357_9ZZZZ|nr:hypothetical protein ALOHA_HF4000ANIW93N21ctg1g23 [uncultured marine microorganism HF4000_ANIW93N21]
MLRIVRDFSLDLQQTGGPAADGFQHAQRCHHLTLLLGQHGPGRRRKFQCGGEPKVFQDTPVVGGQEVGVAVDQSWEYRLPRAFYLLGGGMGRRYFWCWTDCHDSVAVDGDGGIVKHGPAVVPGHEGRVLDDGGHVVLAPSRRLSAV